MSPGFISWKVTVTHESSRGTEGHLTDVISGTDINSACPGRGCKRNEFETDKYRTEVKYIEMVILKWLLVLLQ